MSGISNGFSAYVLNLLRASRRRLRKRGFLEQKDVPASMILCTREDCPECVLRRKQSKAPRVVFLCFALDRPSGGIKVIYRQAELLLAEGVECCVFHPDNPEFSLTWFQHGARIERSGHFDPRYDFLIVPELMAAVTARFCLDFSFHYAIYVQNGYILQVFGMSDIGVVENAYEHATFVLAISKDSAEAVKLAFPSIEQHQIVLMRLSVPAIFKANAKRRVITFMPRKLFEHAAMLQFYLKPHLPEGWSLEAIDQASEQKVAEALSQSSIFLSFSHMEGLGLPPIEAALAGNIVVGYTGEGGKEYFFAPIFRPIENADFISFVHGILAAIRDVESGQLKSKEYAEQREQLLHTYSLESELATLKGLHEHIVGAMAVAP